MGAECKKRDGAKKPDDIRREQHWGSQDHPMPFGECCAFGIPTGRAGPGLAPGASWSVGDRRARGGTGGRRSWLVLIELAHPGPSTLWLFRKVMGGTPTPPP